VKLARHGDRVATIEAFEIVERRRADRAAPPGRATRYSGPFVGRLGEMLESPAFMILSGAAQRVLFRLEIELLHHGGNDNGKLVVTFDQFEKYGVRRKSIASALRELEALGFIEVVEHGCAGNAGYGKRRWCTWSVQGW